MRMYDLIEKKKLGLPLTNEELAFFVEGVTSDKIPDYQTSALLMAIYFNSMTEKETATLTQLMANSGETMNLSAIEGFKVDKHSTGGVGDKTTLIVAPIVASCGVRVAKMSGRGLGHTGGTVDKLESIKGFQSALSTERFFEIVNTVGVAVVGQTGNLAPCDKKLYALRDVTATIDSIPLIAASIMSKKLAAGADAIVLDVKVGSGAFMKTREDAVALAKRMVSIGEHIGKKTLALITDMGQPLGEAIGNSLEVCEAIHTLKGKGPADLTDVSLELAANMLLLAGKGSLMQCRELAADALYSGKALQTLRKMVEAQQGDVSYIDDPENFPKALNCYTIYTKSKGFVAQIDAEQIGLASVLLGAGRETKDSPIDHSAGIILPIKVGSSIQPGDILAKLYSNDSDTFMAAQRLLNKAVVITDNPPPAAPLIVGRVSADETVLFS